MRFFYSAASLVLAFALAVSSSALAAHRHKSSHRVTHHATARAGHHPASASSRTAHESVKRHRAEHARHRSVHHAARHSTRHSSRIAERREPPRATKASSSRETETASVYRVRRGDSLSDIASHFGVTVEQLRQWNHLHGSAIRAGYTLRVGSRPTPERVAASQPEAQAAPEARPEAESKNLAEMIPPIPMRDGHLYVPPPLVGSHASLVRQNERGVAEGLKRIQNVAQLNALRHDGKLVPLPVGKDLRANPDLPADRRCTRPWTAKFLANLAHAHYVRFDRPLQVNSAVRTVKFQRRLIRVNGNAAPATGEIASPHLMGATIDIGKKGLSISEVAWMRAYLLPLEQDGKIDVEEEFYQSCFHITVYKSYLPRTRKARRTPAALLATGVR